MFLGEAGDGVFAQAQFPAAVEPAAQAVVLLTSDDWQPTATVPVAAEADEGRTPYAIPPAPECEVVGGNSVAELFRPLSAVQVTGASTAPPTS